MVCEVFQIFREPDRAALYRCAGGVTGVQEFMGLAAAGLLQEFLVQGLHCRVQV